MDKSSRHRNARNRLLIIAICILAATLTNQVSPASTRSLTAAGPSTNYLLAPPNSTPNATIAVSPNATVDLTMSMKQITIQITLSPNPASSTPNVPPFNAVSVLLSYDARVINASSLDFSTNVFAQATPNLATRIVRDCLDGLPAPGQTTAACGSDDGPGFVSFAESIIGGATPDGTQGNIFILTMNVVTKTPNFSQIQIKNALLGYGSTQIPTALSNGYYTSLSCGGKACQPAAAKFTWSPQPAKMGIVTSFYGNASTPSQGASITDFFWTFGDTSTNNPYRDSRTNSTSSWLYSISGTYPVTLKITDSLGVVVSTTQRVNVINTEVDMGIDDVKVDPNPVGQYAGVVFTITAIIKNHGGLPEKTNLTIALYGQAKPLTFLNTTLFAPQAQTTVTAKWDSTGKIPNVYRVDVFTPILTNESLTDHNPNFVSSWIQIVGVQPSGSLSLLSTAGISVLVVGAGSIGVSFLRKRNRNLDDAL